MNGHANEIKAIRTLRDQFSTTGQMTLAKKIVANNFIEEKNRKLATDATCGGLRPMLSVYSVIRRYDAARLVNA